MNDGVMDNVSQAIETPAVVDAAPTEKMLPQSMVNDIVGRAKHEAAQKAVEDFKRQQTHNAQQTQNDSYYNQNSQKGMSENDIKKFASEELARQRDQWIRESQEKSDADAAQRIVRTYQEKIAAGAEKYEDFAAVTNSVDMRLYPNVVQLLADYVDNSHDVLYELAKNRTKLYQLESMCNSSLSQDAVYEVKRLADSIKANEETSNIRTAKTPLSQQRPSHSGTDSGVLSMQDLKRKYKG